MDKKTAKGLGNKRDKRLDALCEEAVRRLRSGEPLLAISRLLGMDNAALHQALTRRGLPTCRRDVGLVWLSPRERAIAQFNEHGLATAEIAAKLGISRKNVTTTLRRAREKIGEMRK